MRLELHYSVQNGGDGSAYPKFMESKELAKFDQEHMNESWGESCTGTLTFESETDIKCDEEIATKESYFIDKYCDDDHHRAARLVLGHVDYDEGNEKSEFLSQFFPDGLPAFSVEIEQPTKNKGYLYNYVFVDGKRVAKSFRAVAESGKVFEDLLNSQSE